MPTATSGIYEVVLEQTYQNQSIFNVFHYKHTLDLDDVQEDCADAFDQDMLPAISTIQNLSVAYTNIRASNLTGNLADFNLVPSIAAGIVAGDVVVGFVAAPFRYNRETKDTRNGAKRFTGLSELFVKTTGFEPAFFTIMQTAALVFGTNIDVVGAIFEPIILRKPPSVGPIFTFNTITGVTAINRTTSQNSRKVF